MNGMSTISEAEARRRATIQSQATNETRTLIRRLTEMRGRAEALCAQRTDAQDPAEQERLERKLDTLTGHALSLISETNQAISRYLFTDIRVPGPDIPFEKLQELMRALVLSLPSGLDRVIHFVEIKGPKKFGRSTGLLNYAAISERTGIGVATLRTYRRTGHMPAPDSTEVSDRPLWLTETIEEWIANRPGQGRRPRKPKDELALRRGRDRSGNE